MEQLENAAKSGVDMLLLPEYSSEHWMHFAPAGLPLTSEIGWMAGQAAIVIPDLQEAVRKTGVALIAGSMPWPDGKGGYFNRAWGLFPDREAVFQDKLVLTPFEKDPNDWTLEKGLKVGIFEWRGFRMAILICLDIEMPDLSHRLATRDIDLILVPSMTEKPSGYHRVFGCAKARAIELMAAVAVVGLIGGSSKDGEPRPGCSSGASVFIPCEEVFGYNGIHSEIPLANKADGLGPMLMSRDIPLAQIRAIRHGNPEVWPGPWSAKDIEISG